VRSSEIHCLSGLINLGHLCGFSWSPDPQLSALRRYSATPEEVKPPKKIRRQQLPAGRIFDDNTAESAIRFGVGERGQR
jgi:hypothetical protein